MPFDLAGVDFSGALAVIELIGRILVGVVEALLIVPLGYVAVLSLAAIVVALRPARRITEPRTTRFVILIPAHNEAAVIAKLLASLRVLDYPQDLFSPLVIADNCTDATAAIVRAAGVRVLERTSETERAKGYALRYALEQLVAAGEGYDAYVIVDADTVFAPVFLREMDAALRQGALVAQGQYRVLNAGEGWAAGLRAVAFALINHVRPLGRSLFGLSAGLKGNGMVFSRAVIERFSWAAYGLTEDAEYHVTLIKAGIRVAYVPRAIVAAEMPASVRQSGSQQERWERGRIELARAHGLGMLAGFLRTGDVARLDVAVESLTPPLSLLAAGVVFALMGAVVLRWELGLWVALGLLAALILHVAVGIALGRLPFRVVLSLLAAPFYIVWKSVLFLGALVARGAGSWIRTPRNDEQARQANGADGADASVSSSERADTLGAQR
ncbi:MAG TPA: glycosyltransferase family 2 protein [Ktedonobacterales bacterium]|jgi:cellulose synthase/poly-beta-1,6-N-acetylglucosamine synthase-like glycosyltransferase